MAEQSPFELFSSSRDKKNKKSSPPSAPHCSSSPRKKASAFNVEEALLAMHNKQKLWEKILEVVLSRKEYEEVKNRLPTLEEKRKTEELIARVAESVGEKKLPPQYLSAITKVITEKQRKGKMLGAKKGWMPIH